MKATCLLVLLAFTTTSTFTDGYKILMMLPTAGPSQLNLLLVLANGLGERGHSVTVITTTYGKSTHKNVEVHATKAPAFSKEAIQQLMELAANSSVLSNVIDIFSHPEHACRIFYEHQKVRVLLAAKRHLYDLVIVDMAMAECVLPLAAVVAPVVMYACSGPVMAWQAYRLPAPPSYVPTYFRPYSDRMSFLERLNNAYIYASIRLYYEYVAIPSWQAITDEYIKDAPTIREAEKKAHFMIANQDPVLFSIRPTMPNVVNVGGYHCRPGLPLPKDLNDFVEGSGEHGFVMFGLGSNAKAEFLGEETIQALVRTFARLKQRVIWKFETELKNMPSNVRIISWMPQQDLLAHPKIRLFISHGGALSMQEAIYHGVPIIGVPLFFDQFGNVARMKELGMGEHMGVKNISEELAYTLITNILNDKSYKENAKKYSAIFKDNPQTPLETAMFWVEYAIRHKGAEHLRSAAEDLNFFQYFLLDILAVVVGAALFVLFIMIKMFKLLSRLVSGGGSSSASKNTQNKKKRN